MSDSISKDSIVQLKYEIFDSTGKSIERTPEDNPFTYLHGRKQVIPGLEKDLEGKQTGYSARLILPAEDAYGSYDDTLVAAISRDHFEDETGLTVGAFFHFTNAQGDEVLVRIKDIGEEEVLIDANHPLAGQEITFELKVLNVREAEPEELETGLPNPTA